MFFKKTLNPVYMEWCCLFFFNYIYAFFSCDDISSFKESVHFVHIGLVPKE